MAVNWLEIGLIVALNAAILAAFLTGTALYVKKRVFPKLKGQAGEWAGAAIGRFWQTLKEKAEEDDEGGGSTSSGGQFNLAGFKIDPQMIQMGMQLYEWAKKVGLIKGDGAGGEIANPFLK